MCLAECILKHNVPPSAAGTRPGVGHVVCLKLPCVTWNPCCHFHVIKKKEKAARGNRLCKLSNNEFEVSIGPQVRSGKRR